jgi:hypothetical protein
MFAKTLLRPVLAPLIGDGLGKFNYARRSEERFNVGQHHNS